MFPLGNLPGRISFRPYGNENSFKRAGFEPVDFH